MLKQDSRKYTPIKVPSIIRIQCYTSPLLSYFASNVILRLFGLKQIILLGHGKLPTIIGPTGFGEIE
jgi:hypothetical protein